MLQQLDYLGFIDRYHERIKLFHVKDAEFNPTGKQGVYGGFQAWVDRAGRFRSLGDGQVDFGAIFSKMAAYDFPGWAVLEWECCIKNPEDGAREGAEFIGDHIIRVADRAFDDFAGGGADQRGQPEDARGSADRSLRALQGPHAVHRVHPDLAGLRALLHGELHLGLRRPAAVQSCL